MRKVLTEKDLRDMERYFASHDIAEIQTKNLTREEEEEYIRKNSFREIRESGYPHINRVMVVPCDGRKPYIIVDTTQE